MYLINKLMAVYKLHTHTHKTACERVYTHNRFAVQLILMIVAKVFIGCKKHAKHIIYNVKAIYTQATAITKLHNHTI